MCFKISSTIKKFKEKVYTVKMEQKQSAPVVMLEKLAERKMETLAMYSISRGRAPPLIVNVKYISARKEETSLICSVTPHEALAGCDTESEAFKRQKRQS